MPQKSGKSTYPRDLDLLIVCENTDIIKYYCDQVIEAFQTIFPKPKVCKSTFSELNKPGKSHLRSCKKLLFFTDEKIRSFSTERIRATMAALLKSRDEANRIFVVNTSCSSEESEGILHPSESENTLDKIQSRVANINDIKKIDLWWPHVLKLVLDVVPGRRDILFSFTSDNTSLFDYENFSGKMEKCLTQFKTMLEEQCCHVILSDTCTITTVQSSRYKDAKTYFISCETRLTGNQSIIDIQTVYGKEEILKLLLHIVIDFEAVFARRTSVDGNKSSSFRSTLALLIMLVNIPLILFLFLFSFCPMLCLISIPNTTCSERLLYLLSVVMCLSISGTAIGLGVKLQSENNLSPSLLVFLCIVIPLYFILWVSLYSWYLHFKKDMRFGVISLPYTVCDGMPFPFFHTFCFSNFVKNNRRKFGVLISVLSFPYVLIVLVYLFVNFVCTCGSIFCLIFETKPTSKTEKTENDDSTFDKDKFRRILYVTTQLQVQVAFAFLSVVVGIVVRQHLVCFLIVPLYLLLVISPGDYLLGRAYSPTYGIFSVLKLIL